MANYYGSARSNAVTIVDMVGLEKALAPFSGVQLSSSCDGKTVFLGDDPDNGSFPSQTVDDDGNDLEFSWEAHVMPYVAENEVLVVMEAGAEKLRYIIGYSAAYIRVGNKVQSVGIDINDIYKKAATKFDIPLANIVPAEY